MAATQKRIEVILGARDASRKVFDSYEARFDRVKRTVVGLAATAGLALGAREIGRFVAGSVAAYAEQEKAAAGLGRALRDAGDKSTGALEDFEAYASGLQAITTQGDEATLTLGAYISTIGKLTGGGLQEATTATLGLARATGQGQQIMARAYLNTLSGNYSMLERYIPALRAATSEEQKAALVRELVARGMNQLTEDAGTYAGRVAQLQNAWGDFREEIGGALVPTLRRGVEVGSEVVGVLQANKAAIGSVAAVAVSGAAALGGVKLAMLGLNVASKSMLGLDVGSALWSIAAAGKGMRLSMLQATGATLAQAAAAGVLRVAAVALQVTMTAGLAVGLGLVAAGFMRARREGTSFGEALRRIGVDMGIFDGSFDASQAAAEKVKSAVKQVAEAEAALGEADSASDRLVAQETLVAAIKAEGEARQAERKVAQDIVAEKLADAKKLADWKPNAKVWYVDPKLIEEAKARVATLEQQLEGMRGTGAKIDLNFTGGLGAAQAALKEMRAEVAAVPGLDLISAEGEEKALGFLDRAFAKIEALRKKRLEGGELLDDVVSFAGTPLEQELRGIQREAEGLVGRLQRGARSGVIDEAAAEREIASVREAARKQVAAAEAEAAEKGQAGGEDGAAAGREDRRGVEALELSRRFLGLADSFGQGQADPAERAAAAAERGAEEQRRTREAAEKAAAEQRLLRAALERIFSRGVGGGGGETLDGPLGGG